MLIDFHSMVIKYDMRIRGLIHGGIHFGQEIDSYKKEGIDKMMLFEPCEEAFKKVLQKVWDMKEIHLYNFALGASNFFTTMNVEKVNQGQSNSILKPKLHLEQHPSIIFNDTEEIEVRTLDSAMIEPKEYNLMVLDLQGYELEALKGSIHTLPFIDYLCLEVNRAELYEGCAQVEEIDAFLSEFTRVETKWIGGWGDGWYVRTSLLNKSK